MTKQAEMFYRTPHGGLAPIARGQGGHENSRESFHAPGAALGRSERTAAILGWLAMHGPATDRDIAAGLGFADLNAVRPRITEGIQSGLFVELLLHARCPVTGKLVRRVAAAITKGGAK
jgi:hypothetical protein